MLHRASAVAADSGVVLAIENHIDLYADELVELCESIDSPALGVCLDTANNLRLFEHPVEVARKLAPWTRATHVKDIAATRGDPRTFAFWPSVPWVRVRSKSTASCRSCEMSIIAGCWRLRSICCTRPSNRRKTLCAPVSTT